VHTRQACAQVPLLSVAAAIYMLRSRYSFAAAGLPGGRIVCVGGFGGGFQSAEVWGPPVQGAPDAA
jgi:hypothetical protein